MTASRHGRLAVLGTLCALAIAAAPAAARTPVLQLPDLRQELPGDLTLTQVGDQMRLGFRSATDNIGLGPLIIEGRRASTRRNLMHAEQVIEVDGGPIVRRGGDGRLSYVRLRDHQHWHLADFMRYELRREDNHDLVRPGMKTGFCLGDRVNLDIFTRMPNEPEAGVFTSQCGLRNPERLTIREGISVGHADYYAANIEGQWMDITTVPSGRYWLIHRADAANRIFELDETNNAASLLLDIDRQPLDDGGTRMVLRVVRTCPFSAYCNATKEESDE